MHQPKSSRRTFVKQSGAALAAAAAAASIASRAYAQGNGTIQVGLVGCGGRGTGAAGQALNADDGVKLTALGDVFADQAQSTLERLAKDKDTGDRVEVTPETIYSGFDAYKHVIDQCDVVLLATPPHFRPMHLKYAVERGKHVFVEKPVAVDPVGVRSVLETCELAERKGLSIVSGLCWRYSNEKVATLQKVLDGAIGDIVSIQTTYNSQGVWDPRRRRDEVGSDMEYQMRNWYYYCWLSGDHIVEQAVHSLDKMGWAMHDEPPVRCTGTGGRAARLDEKYGNIWDHFSVVYEYASGVKGFHNCRHWRRCTSDVSDHIMGAKGVCDVFKHRISGEQNWQYEGERNNMYQAEHDEFFKSIRAGKPINNGLYMCRSTMLAIMGRMSAYTGKTITWDEAMNSTLDLSPPSYEWGPLEMRPVPVPGVTKFV